LKTPLLNCLKTAANSNAGKKIGDAAFTAACGFSVSRTAASVGAVRGLPGALYSRKYFDSCS